jgi:hypothetical protein
MIIAALVLAVGTLCALAAIVLSSPPTTPR